MRRSSQNQVGTGPAKWTMSLQMKRTAHVAGLLILLTVSSGRGQGTFIYDQQSSDESYFGSGARGIQSNQPFGQSFTPSLTAIDFIRIHLGDSVNDGLGAMIRINLRTNSISGAVIASTSPVSVASQFIGTADFFFAATVSLTPGTKYYFQPEVVSGGAFSASSYNNFGYAGGDAYYAGALVPGFDLWFREGIRAPEPSAASLFLASIALIVSKRRTGDSKF